MTPTRQHPPARLVRRTALWAVVALMAAAIGCDPAPSEAAGLSGFVSDDFDSATLDPAVWSVVDPRGDGTVQTVGAGTGNAHLSMSVPAGLSHDAWTNNQSLRAVQDVSDGDLDIQARFDTTPTAKYQMHGLIVEQADGGFVRFGVHHNGGSLRLYGATVTPSSGTKRHESVQLPADVTVLRLTRTGQDWTMQYSADGSSWSTATSFTYAFTPVAAGVFTGNSGPSPAYTALVDYVFDTDSPVDPEDGSQGPAPDDTPPVVSGVAVDAGTTTATVSFTTDEPATTVVEAGATTSYDQSVSGDLFATEHTATLEGLAPGTTYHYSITATNLEGLESTTTDDTFETLPPPPSAGFVSDDFDLPAVDTNLWSVVDPRGDSTVQTLGAGTGDAYLSTGVPAGTAHDAWKPNNATRVMQSVTDGDFDIAARFATTPNSRYQMHGLMAEQADGRFVRYGLHHTGSSLRLYAATISPAGWSKRLDVPVDDGEAAVLRMTRSGDDWTLRYSADGTTFTTATTFSDSFQLASLGLFSGNNGAGSNVPAYTALADYAFDVATPIDPEDGPGGPAGDSTPPVISGVVTQAGPTSATVSWTTDDPSTSAVDYGTTAAYGALAGSGGYATDHTVLITGLEPGTTYHFSARSSNLSGLETASADGTFATTPPRPDAGFESDDFLSGLDPARWTVVDPLGDGTVTMDQPSPCDSRIALSVPAGVTHDPFTTNNALRAMQPIDDGDLDVAASFMSTPTQAYQQQGMLVQESATKYLRYGVHFDGAGMRVYAATFNGSGGSSTRVNTSVPAAQVAHLRVTRFFDTWTLSYSPDGVAWTTAGTFDFAMAVSAAGVFAGNSSAGQGVPGHTAVVDYVFDVGAPIDPEDGGDDCEAYELTTDVVGEGTIVRSPNASSYGVGTSVSLTAVPAAGWLFDGWSGAASGTGNPTSVTVDGPTGVTATFVVDDTPPPPVEGPTIDVWYGDDQVVGDNGQPQRWANLQGNVSDANGVASLSYTVNGGTSRSLSVGSDLRRLYGAGDFNVEIDYDDLTAGPNEVVITAVDGVGDTSTETVVVTRATGPAPTLPFSTDWSSAGAVNDEAQVVDGKWQVEGATIRAVEPGYDRTVALGDRSWTDYEVTTSLTVDSLAPGWGTPQSGAPLVGLGMRWDGHSQIGSEQPRRNWFPTGSFMWWRWGSDGTGGAYRLTGNDDWPVKGFNGPGMTFGTTYMMKVRAETVSGGTQYSAKVWAAGTAEPAAWQGSIVEDDGPPSGGVLLISHHVVAHWGDVVVTPLTP